jgi:hypothetical protein
MEALKFGPCCRMANLASRLRDRKGRSEITGRMMSDTRAFAQAVKEAARLQGFDGQALVYRLDSGEGRGDQAIEKRAFC